MRSIPLPIFLSRAAGRKQLRPAGRRRLVEQALLLLESFYVHLPQKRAMYAIDPVQRLKLLLERLPQFTDDLDLYRELIDIFTSLRDFHTRFELPPPFDSAVAYLPFVIEAYHSGANGTPRYIISHLIPGFRHPDLGRGVEVTHWNGIPIGRAVDLLAAENPGGNRAARYARGLNRLTVRPMLRALPPEGEWVIVGYRTRAGTQREYRANWSVLELPDASAALAASARMTELALDRETDAIRSAKKLLFAPHVVTAEARAARRWRAIKQKKARGRKKDAVGSRDLESLLPDVFEARPVPTKSGPFGYVRIRTFMKDPPSLVEEFTRLIQLLPQNGLILDLRDNGGGQISGGEQLLQLLTPREITPEGAQFISTEKTRQLCQLNAPSQSEPGLDLSPWLPSLKLAVETGAIFSGIHPISDPAACNRLGQRYYGPVVLITNALCYSATDIFAAGFRDHRIGTILGVDANTGAGGANPFEHDLLRTLFSGSQRHGSGSPIKKLPNGCTIQVAMRRTLRVGAQSGTVLEDLGVTPDERHPMTKDDLLEQNVDLIEHAVSLLARQPRYRLAVACPVVGDTTLNVATENITKLDVTIDNRLQHSGRVRDGKNPISLDTPLRRRSRLELRGYKGVELVAARKLEVQ